MIIIGRAANLIHLGIFTEIQLNIDFIVYRVRGIFSYIITNNYFNFVVAFSKIFMPASLKTKVQQPHIIDLKSIGSSYLGYITVAEFPKNIPFEIKRTYWTYYTPNNVERGNHAHKELQQIIVAVAGVIEFDLESIQGDKFNFKLDNPNQGLYIPKEYWRVIHFSHSAVLLCLASLEYDIADYIRDYNEFKKLK